MAWSASTPPTTGATRTRPKTPSPHNSNSTMRHTKLSGGSRFYSNVVKKSLLRASSGSSADTQTDTQILVQGDTERQKNIDR